MHSQQHPSEGRKQPDSISIITLLCIQGRLLMPCTTCFLSKNQLLILPRAHYWCSEPARLILSQSHSEMHCSVTPSQTSAWLSKPQFWVLIVAKAGGCFIFRFDQRIVKSGIINESGHFHTHQQVLAISRQSGSATLMDTIWRCHTVSWCANCGFSEGDGRGEEMHDRREKVKRDYFFAVGQHVQN